MATTQALLAGLASPHRPIDVGQRPLLEVNLLLTGDQRVQTLNREYRGIDQPTDVLSFSQLEGEAGFVAPPSAALALGDVVISLETARRQAAQEAHSLAWEVCHLAVHGALHLLGYDHQTDEQEAEMNGLAHTALPARLA